MRAWLSNLTEALRSSFWFVPALLTMTTVLLSFASSQLGPRLLRKFTGNRGNQLVLGTFISTFIYSVLVLRATRDSAQTFIPYISVTLAILLALLSVAVLIYFI